MNKSIQFHDSSIGHARQRRDFIHTHFVLISCRETRSISARLLFGAHVLKFGRLRWRSVQFMCCEQVLRKADCFGTEIPPSRVAKQIHALQIDEASSSVRYVASKSQECLNAAHYRWLESCGASRTDNRPIYAGRVCGGMKWLYCGLLQQGNCRQQTPSWTAAARGQSVSAHVAVSQPGCPLTSNTEYMLYLYSPYKTDYEQMTTSTKHTGST